MSLYVTTPDPCPCLLLLFIFLSLNTIYLILFIMSVVFLLQLEHKLPEDRGFWWPVLASGTAPVPMILPGMQ